MDTPRRLAVWKPWGNGEAMKRNERRVPYSSAKALACAFSTFAVLALALTGCAPKANDAVVTGEDEAAAVQVDFTWSETGDCSMCHAKEQASFEDGSCAISRHKDVACSQCHADVAALSAAHEGATAEKAAKAVLKNHSGGCCDVRELSLARRGGGRYGWRNRANRHEWNDSEPACVARIGRPCRSLLRELSSDACGGLHREEGSACMRQLSSRRRVRMLHLP